MPIRINLLAEAQAAEELRRRDPVKRAIYIAAAWGGLMIAVSLVIQSQVLAANRKATGFADRIRAVTNEYAAVMQDMEKLTELRLHRRGLDLLASERFLNGSLLNALQKTSVPDVEFVRIRTQFSYTVVEGTRSKTNANKMVKPATAAEQIELVVEARDVSLNPGDQVGKLKEALARNEHLRAVLGTNNEVRLVNLSPPLAAPGTGRPAVQFTLESKLPEKVRLDIASPTRYAAPKAAAKPGVKVANNEF
jgi:hypothetical protein